MAESMAGWQQRKQFARMAAQKQTEHRARMLKCGVVIVTTPYRCDTDKDVPAGEVYRFPSEHSLELWRERRDANLRR